MACRYNPKSFGVIVITSYTQSWFVFLLPPCFRSLLYYKHCWRAFHQASAGHLGATYGTRDYSGERRAHISVCVPHILVMFTH